MGYGNYTTIGVWANNATDPGNMYRVAAYKNGAVVGGTLLETSSASAADDQFSRLQGIGQRNSGTSDIYDSVVMDKKTLVTPNANSTTVLLEDVVATGYSDVVTITGAVPNTSMALQLTFTDAEIDLEMNLGLDWSVYQTWDTTSDPSGVVLAFIPIAEGMQYRLNVRAWVSGNVDAVVSAVSPASIVAV